MSKPPTNRPYANLMYGAASCDRMLRARSEDLHDGWSNSATWVFNLYFLQERKNHEALVTMIRGAKKKGRAFTEGVYRRAKMLMENAYILGNMEPFDGDEEGSVNVREIVDTLAAEILTDTVDKGAPA